jgi:hypothetical protein
MTTHGASRLATKVSEYLSLEGEAPDLTTNCPRLIKRPDEVEIPGDIQGADLAREMREMIAEDLAEERAREAAEGEGPGCGPACGSIDDDDVAEVQRIAERLSSVEGGVALSDLLAARIERMSARQWR